MKPISIVLVDDHVLMLDTLAGWLNAEQDMEVIATTDSAEDALSVALKTQPDVIMFDIDMPGLSSFEAAGSLTRRLEGTRVIFLSAYSRDCYIKQAIDSGASGYITKKEPYRVVVNAIRAVAGGDAYFSKEIQSRIVVKNSGASLMTRADTLTKREREVLHYVAQGMSNRGVAKTIKLSANTVDVHVTNIMNKLDIHDRVSLARFAYQEGLADA